MGFRRFHSEAGKEIRSCLPSWVRWCIARFCCRSGIQSKRQEKARRRGISRRRRSKMKNGRAKCVWMESRISAHSESKPDFLSYSRISEKKAHGTIIVSSFPFPLPPPTPLKSAETRTASRLVYTHTHTPHSESDVEGHVYQHVKLA